MKMQLETRNRKAFELVTDALRELDRYKRSREYTQLERAKSALDGAKTLDPEYLRALYYSGMVSDLLGKPQQAIETFKRILDENPPFIEEVRYNLAVAHYHRYDWANLEKGVEHFQTVIRNTPDAALRLLARAGLAQTYAMRMIPKDPRSPDLQQIQEQFTLCGKEYTVAIEELSNARKLDEETANEVQWTIYNARGMSLMYHSDYFGGDKERIGELKQALNELGKADYFSPKNWGNYCDLGSAHMRLGYWCESDEEFHKALNYLDEVVRLLRPSYGFALYEIGRAYRLMGQFKEALAYLARSQEIPYEERNVHERRISLERERAERGSREYP